MSVLGYEKLIEKKDEIFLDNSYFIDNFKAASYELRVSKGEALVDGNHYSSYDDDQILIPPHQITILTPMERVSVPNDLMGKIALRFSFSSKGLTILGGHVDPLFKGELILIVNNLSDAPVTILPGEPFAIISFFTVDRGGDLEITLENDKKFKKEINKIPGYVVDEWRSRNSQDITRLVHEQEMRINSFTKKIDQIDTTSQVIITGGISLIAVTILSVVLQVVFATWNSSLSLINGLLINNENIYPFSPMAILFLPIVATILFMIFIIVGIVIINSRNNHR